jgi:hypothetical protein
MDKSQIREVLISELNQLSRLTFKEAEALSTPIHKHVGNSNKNDDNFCQLQIWLLDRCTDSTGTSDVRIQQALG